MTKNYKYDLSVCVPSIRKEHWKRLYDSIVKSVGEYSFELILCGPHGELPSDLEGTNNIKLIKDFGSPVRACQIAIDNARGKYVIWGADDGWFFRSKLERCLFLLEKVNDKKFVIVTQYVEGAELALRDYTMNFHEPLRSPYYPDDFLIINVGIASLEYLKELGGFDCRFQGMAMALPDWGARAQLDGAKTYFLQEVIFECEQFPGTEGDHAPVHFSQLEDDQPLYRSIWRKESCLERIKIDFDNWKNSPMLWKRRFDAYTVEVDGKKEPVSNYLEIDMGGKKFHLSSPAFSMPSIKIK